MCFSPEASFLASAGLAVSGAAAFHLASADKKFLAALPLFFALQQAFEGVQWLYVRSGSQCEVATYGFLFFALMVWPVAVPLFVHALDEKRRPITRWFLGAGILLAVYFLYVLVINGAVVRDVNKSIHYQLTTLVDYRLGASVYLTTVLGPLFISSISAIRWFGVLAWAAGAIAYAFYGLTFISVWCFFGALLSLLVLLYIYLEKRKATREDHVI